MPCKKKKKKNKVIIVKKKKITADQMLDEFRKKEKEIFDIDLKD